jgi:hypothetical protein
VSGLHVSRQHLHIRYNNSIGQIHIRYKLVIIRANPHLIIQVYKMNLVLNHPETIIFIICFLFLINVGITVTYAQPDHLKVSVSVMPANLSRYLADNHTQDLTKASNEQCIDSSRIHQTNNNITTKMQINITGFEETRQHFLPTDMIVVMDSSGSMKENDHSNLRLNAAKELINNTNPTRGDKSAVVSFDDNIDFSSPLTSDSAAISSRVDSVDSSGDTDLDTGLNTAISILDMNNRAEPSSKAIVFLSDGEEKYTPAGELGSSARRCQN